MRGILYDLVGFLQSDDRFRLRGASQVLPLNVSWCSKLTFAASLCEWLLHFGSRCPTLLWPNLRFVARQTGAIDPSATLVRADSLPRSRPSPGGIGASVLPQAKAAACRWACWWGRSRRCPQCADDAATAAATRQDLIAYASVASSSIPGHREKLRCSPAFHRAIALSPTARCSTA